jgi:hypothetical protein
VSRNGAAQQQLRLKNVAMVVSAAVCPNATRLGTVSQRSFAGTLLRQAPHHVRSCCQGSHEAPAQSRPLLCFQRSLLPCSSQLLPLLTLLSRRSPGEAVFTKTRGWCRQHDTAAASGQQKANHQTRWTCTWPLWEAWMARTLGVRGRNALMSS